MILSSFIIVYLSIFFTIKNISFTKEDFLRLVRKGVKKIYKIRKKKNKKSALKIRDMFHSFFKRPSYFSHAFQKKQIKSPESQEIKKKEKIYF